MDKCPPGPMFRRVVNTCKGGPKLGPEKHDRVRPKFWRGFHVPFSMPARPLGNRRIFRGVGRSFLKFLEKKMIRSQRLPRIPVMFVLLVLTAALPIWGQGRMPMMPTKHLAHDVSRFSIKGIIGGDGRSRIREFRGHPLILAYWDRQGAAGLAGAKRALKFHEKFAKKGLSVILIERVIWNFKDAELKAKAFLLQELGPLDGIALAGFQKDFHDLVRPMQSSYSRYMGLVGVDGILRAGGPSSMVQGKLDKALLLELKKVKKGWGTKKERKIRAMAFGKGKLGDALNMAQESNDDEQVHDAATDVRSYFKYQLQAVTKDLDNACWANAKRKIVSLSAAVSERKGLAKKVASLQERLLKEATPEELDAEKKISAILKKIDKGKGGRPVNKKLMKLAESSAAPHAAARARRLLKLVAFLKG